MVNQLAEPKGGKRKTLSSRWNPFKPIRRILNRKKEKYPSESEMEHHDHSTVNNSCGSNSGSHVSPSTMDDFQYLVTYAPKSGIWEGDANSEGSGLLVELPNDDSSACESQGHASFTQLDVSRMKNESPNDPSLDQGKRFVYRTFSAREKAGLLVMGDTTEPEEMEELGTEVIYSSSESFADRNTVDGGSEIIFANDVSRIFGDDADDSGNDIFLSFEALGLLHSTDSEAERRNPLDSKAWDIHKSTDESEADLDDGHAFKSSEMCQPISSESERRRLDVETTLALNCDGEFKALGLREASQILDKKREAEGVACDGKINALSLLEPSATGHGKVGKNGGLGCEGEFEALGLRAVGKARYRNRQEYDGDAYLATRSVMPPIPSTIETPRRLTLDYQLSDDSSDSINRLQPTASSGSVTWLSHDDAALFDFDERPVKEITIPSPSRKKSGAKPSSPSQAFRTTLARTRDRLVEGLKESMLIEPAVAPPIKRVVANGVRAANSKSPLNHLGRSSNLFTSPFETESESGSKSSLFPRTSPSPPSEHLYHSPPSKLHSPPRASESRSKNALNSKSSDFHSGLTEFSRERSEFSIPTPNTWPLSKLATKYGMKNNRLDRYASPERGHDAFSTKSERSPLGTKDSVSTSADSSNKASRTSKTYATSSDGSEASPLRSTYSTFRTELSKSRSADTSSGSLRTPKVYTSSFVTSYSGASYDDVGCMFDDDDASARSDDAEHEIVFSDANFMQDVSTELLHSFEELAREGSAVMSGLWSMK